MTTPTEHYWQAQKELELGARTGSEVTYLAAVAHALMAIEGHLRVMADIFEKRER